MSKTDTNSAKPKRRAGMTHKATAWRSAMVKRYAFKEPGELMLLATAGQALDRMWDAQALLAKDGQVVYDKFDQIKTHPSNKIETDSRNGFLQCLKALNIDSAGAKAISAEVKDPNSVESILDRKAKQANEG